MSAVEPSVPHARPVRSGPIVQTDVEADLLYYGSTLEATVEDYETAQKTAANAEATFRIEHAKALLRSKGTVAERQAWADYNCEAHLRAHLVAQAAVKGLRERLAMLHANLDKARSLNANVRPQVN